MLKPFNLEEALQNPDKIYTRSGLKARIICNDCKGDNPIVALIDNGKFENVWDVDINGYHEPDVIDEWDLMLEDTSSNKIVISEDAKNAIASLFYTCQDKEVSKRTIDAVLEYVNSQR